jgi:hypothetical protein
MLTRLRLLLFAARALATARRRIREAKARTPDASAGKLSGERRKALQRLGGACACCGLGMDFARVFEFHHVNHNGDLHRRVMKAFSVGPVMWVLETPAPHLGLFALEVRCVNCHRMLHEAGECPHMQNSRREAA